MKAAEHHCFLHRFLALAAVLLLLGGLIFAPALSAPVLADSTTQTLRVGYYAYDGFNMIDSDGSYSGYSYDLLQKIARTQLWQDAPPDAAGVYRVLRDMESRGLIRSHMDSASKAAIGKRVFEITDAGRICMKNWIETLEQYRRGIDEVILHLRESLSDPPVPDGVSSPTAENLCCCCVSAAVSKP